MTLCATRPPRAPVASPRECGGARPRGDVRGARSVKSPARANTTNRCAGRDRGGVRRQRAGRGAGAPEQDRAAGVPVAEQAAERRRERSGQQPNQRGNAHRAGSRRVERVDAERDREGPGRKRHPAPRELEPAEIPVGEDPRQGAEWGRDPAHRPPIGPAASHAWSAPISRTYRGGSIRERRVRRSMGLQSRQLGSTATGGAAKDPLYARTAIGTKHRSNSESVRANTSRSSSWRRGPTPRRPPTRARPQRRRSRSTRSRTHASLTACSNAPRPSRGAIESNVISRRGELTSIRLASGAIRQ